MNAKKAAQIAAEKDFNEYLDRMNATAAGYVPASTIEAAEKAYKNAGGKQKIKVNGYGNTTHPVCSVKVVEIK